MYDNLWLTLQNHFALLTVACTLNKHLDYFVLIMEKLLQALGTAEMIVEMVLGYPEKVDSTVFALHKVC